ncbi:MAG: hypothetical protein M1327_06485 [Candidatus Thermoplasmatota archaeon]|nr:hypothetical protein [Candidatus Thermoplasmatota archaeon]
MISRTQPIPAGSGWVEYAQYYYTGNLFYPGAFGCFSSNWKVPNAPSCYNDQIIYLFIGFEPNNLSGILQPVLQYGYNGYQGWQLASWYVVGNNAVHTPFYDIPIGTTIEGLMTGTNFHNAGYGEWTSSFVVPVAPGCFYSVAVLSYQSYSELSDLKLNYAYVTLEAYNFRGDILTNPSCFPSSSPTVFSDLIEKNQHGTSLSPGWTTHQSISGSPFSIIVNSYNQITLYY